MKTLIALARDSLLSIVFHLAPRFANVVVFILIGRMIGPADAGVFTLATTYLLIFTAMIRGLDDLVIRQVSQELDRARSYLTNFVIVRLGLALLSYLVLTVIVRVVFDYAERVSDTILILAVSMVPDSIAYVAQAIMVGQRRLAAPALTWAFTSLFRVVGSIAVLSSGGGLYDVAWVWLFGSLLGMVTLLLVTVRRVGGLRRSDWLDWEPLTRHWRSALAFVSITALAAWETQSDTVILSVFHNETELAWYGAATTVAFSLVMLSQTYRFSVYPLMARYAIESPERLSELYQRSMRYIGALILPAVSGIFLLAPKIVELLFDTAFQPAAHVLRILIWALVFVFLSEPTARLMFVRNRQKWVSLFLVVSTLTNVALNLWLVPPMGATGAAIARVCSTLVFFSLNYYHVSRYIVNISLLRALSRPVLATLAMAFVLMLLESWAFLVLIGVGVVMYGGILWLVGGRYRIDILRGRFRA